jgi:hypothetical protein
VLIGLSGFWPGNNQLPGNIAPWRRPSSHHVLSGVSRSGDLMALRVQIAPTLKFSCQANFTRAFREATGETPDQYRRSVGMIAAEPAATNDNS